MQGSEPWLEQRAHRLLMLLPLAQLNPRYARHYLGDVAARWVFAPPPASAR